MKKYLIMITLVLVAGLAAGREIWARSYEPWINVPLEQVVKDNRVGNWNGLNSLRKASEIAVDRGVGANTIVLLLMLPLVATVVSVLHYVFGFMGYGIFTPTMIAVAFLATGIVEGLVLFGMILATSLFSNVLLRRFKLHFWPARSINLMMITIGTFGLISASTYWRVFDVSRLSVFPMLFMILLTEEFVRTELAKSRKEAKKLMFGTLLLAILGAVIMDIREVQEMVLLYPEMFLFAGILINFAVGNYTGIRLSEIGRFRKAIRKSPKSKSLKV